MCFDTSEISRLRDSSENPSQLQLLGGETLQDNGVRQVGQNLAFNLNNQVNVAYMLNSSRPGQWEGAAVVPKAQSGAKLRLKPGTNRDDKGTRLPVLNVSWLSGLGNDGQQAYSSRGYVSPFGGLVFEDAAPLPPAGALQTGLNRLGGLVLGRTSETSPPIPSTDLARSASNGASNPASKNQGLPIEYNQEFALVLPNTDGATKFRFWWSDEPLLSMPKGWKFKLILRGRWGQRTSAFADQPSPTQTQYRGELRFEFTKDSGSKKDSVYKRKYEDGSLRPRNLSLNPLSLISPIATRSFGRKEQASKWTLGIFVYSQTDIRIRPGDSQPESISEAAGAEFRLTFPVWSTSGGAAQLAFTLGCMLDYQGTRIPSATSSPAGPTNSEPALPNQNQFITLIDSRTGLAATKETPEQYLAAYIDPSRDGAFQAASNIGDYLPYLAFLTDIIAPAIEFLINPSSLLSSSTFPSQGLLPLTKLAESISTNSNSTSLNTAISSASHNDPQAEPDSSNVASLQTSDQGRIRPYFGLQFRLSFPALEGNIHCRLIPYFTFPPFIFPPNRLIARTDVELSFFYTWNLRERINIDLAPLYQGSNPAQSNAPNEIPRTMSAGAPGEVAAESLTIARNLNTHATADATTIPTPIAQLVRANGEAIGIITRLLPGNTGLFELCWVRGRQRPDGLDIDWDASSLQRIAGSAGVTTDIQLIELADGRLAVSASHLDAADPLLLPITQLAPGSLFRVDAASGALADSTALSDNTPQLGLPADRVWAQLGSSLASSGALRSGWSGDSLIAGASGSKDGAGALYILNGNSLASLSDLSALESNSRLDQGLVILGSHQSGSLSGLGTLVVDGGDTNRDGFSEILASATNDLDGAGLVYLLYGGRALELLPTVKSGSIDLDNLDALQANPLTKDQFLQRFSGVSGSSGYGTILAGGHDLNGDGLADPLIGYAADSNRSGSVELWSSRTDLRQQDFLGLGALGQQSIPHFDRSVWVSARSSQADQSDFHLYGANSVGDLNADGSGDLVLSSDNQAAIVFGDRLMPVYWEASTVLGTIANAGDPGPVAATPRPGPPAGRRPPAGAWSSASVAATLMAMAASARASPPRSTGWRCGSTVPMAKRWWP